VAAASSILGVTGVELRGFEPLTPCMPCRCSARLSYSPGNSAMLSGLHRDRFVGDARCVGPQPLQVVVVAGLGVEQVHHHVPVVEQDPAGMLGAFATKRLAFQCRSELGLDLVHQCLHVAVGGTRADDEHVGEHDQPGDVEQGDGGALLVGDGGGGTLGRFDRFTICADGEPSRGRLRAEV
jgi:hypothetical protein